MITSLTETELGLLTRSERRAMVFVRVGATTVSLGLFVQSGNPWHDHLAGHSKTE